MYSYLQGVLKEKSPTIVTLDIHGIGYELIVPLSTHHKLPAAGHSIKLLVHFVVREDAQQLYGFLTEEERSLFRLLLGVSGIGPKMAITVLSGIGIQELKRAIVNGAVPVLCSISGIGRKTAERIVVELREKIILDEQQESAVTKLTANQTLVNDSLQALVSLGYKKQDANAAIQKALSVRSGEKHVDVEELIRQSLKYV